MACRQTNPYGLKRPGWALPLAAAITTLLLAPLLIAAAPTPTSTRAEFQKTVEPILTKFCSDCHADGMNKGGVSFDGLDSDSALDNPDLWHKVLLNVRAGVMPPAKKPRPSDAEKAALAQWIKRDAFGIDPNNPDPGRVTIRRLNRIEYRNTIRDLMGFDFKVDEEFPPDDTGYGFDNIGDVLSISPMLLEKYMQAAELIVNAAVPTIARLPDEKVIPGSAFRGVGATNATDRISFYHQAHLTNLIYAIHAGNYRLVLDLEVLGQFDFDPGRCQLTLKDNDREVTTKEFSWHNNKKFHFEFDQPWNSGPHLLSLDIQPLTPIEMKTNSLDLRIVSVKVQGPLEQHRWVRSKTHERFFPRESAPETPAARLEYAQEVMRRFTTKAFRRPVDEPAVRRLAEIVVEFYTQPGKQFEEGIRQAMLAALSSPRFLFRVETSSSDTLTLRQPNSRAAASSPAREPGGVRPSPGAAAVYRQPVHEPSRTLGSSNTAAPGDGRAPVRGYNAQTRLENPLPSEGSGFPPIVSPSPALLASPIDEFALASRLSYFLWSTMPDQALFDLANRGQLRQQLASQVKRMLADKRAEALVENFVGQWLQVRDVEGIDINARVVLARDDGEEKELKRQIEEFRARLANPQPATNQQAQAASQRPARPRLVQPRAELDGPLRRAMKQETEMCFSHILKQDRSIIELLDSDYTFLNEKLAKHYGITNITGSEMRRVSLPTGSPRGGLLTQGSILVATSNPTRTSPVKRGLFVLDNILGTPTPPPPLDVPLLEEAEKEFKDREPTLREALELHRGKPLCSSCHSRMDPLGLALENFNALGMWREKERGQQIDAVGQLVTGESFQDIRDLKRILATEHRLDFYRCLTEKLLTYALGRGLEYYDVETVDQIVERLQTEQGRFSALLMGVIESAPFQKRRDSVGNILPAPLGPNGVRADSPRPAGAPPPPFAEASLLSSPKTATTSN